MSKGVDFENAYARWLQEECRNSGGRQRFVSADGQRDGLAALVGAVRDPRGARVVHVFHPRVRPPRPLDAVLSRTIEADFIRVEHGGDDNDDGVAAAPLITVVDAKASRRAKLSHQMQVLLYSEVVQRLLTVEGVRHRMSPTGEILLPTGDPLSPGTASAFRLLSLRPLLGTLLGEVVPRAAAVVAATPLGARPHEDAVHWRVSPSCEMCPHLVTCRSEALGTVNGLAYKSDGENRSLRYLNGGRVGDLEDLMRRSGPAREMVPDAEVRAAVGREVVVRPSARVALVRDERFAVLASVFDDPRSGLPFAWAVRVRHAPRGDDGDADDDLAEAADAELADALSACGGAEGTGGGCAGVAEGFARAFDRALTTLCDRQVPAQVYTFSSADAGSVARALVAAAHGDETDGHAAAPAAAPAAAAAAAAAAQGETTAAQRCLYYIGHAAQLLSGGVPLPNRHGHFVDTTKTGTRKGVLVRRAQEYGVPGDVENMNKADLQLAVRAAVEERQQQSAAHRLVPVLKAVRQAFALPVAGFYSLDDCLRCLGVLPDPRLPAAAAAAAAQSGAPTADDAFRAWRSTGGHAAGVVAERRLLLVARLLEKMRERVMRSSDARFLLEARALQRPPALRITQPELRSLVFAAHSEAASTWLAYEGERLAHAGDPMRLRGKSMRVRLLRVLEGPPEGFEHKPRSEKDVDFRVFAEYEVVDGAEYAEADEKNKLTFYKWIVISDSEGGRQSAALLCDSRTLRWTAHAKGAAAKLYMDENVRPASLALYDDAGARLTVVFPFRVTAALSVIGGTYVVRQRATDYNSGTITECLYAIDCPKVPERGPPSFVRLLRNPLLWARERHGCGRSWGAYRAQLERRTRHYRELFDLARPSSAEFFERRSLILNPGQSRILNRLVPGRNRRGVRGARGAAAAAAVAPTPTPSPPSMERSMSLDSWDELDNQLEAIEAASAARVEDLRLLIVWGPPGVGKTHALALSLLRVFEAAALSGRRGMSAFVTGFTHKAIGELVKRVEKLAALMRKYWPGDGGGDGGGGGDRWIHRLEVGLLSDKSFNGAANDGDGRFLVVGGTPYAANALPASVRYDLMLVDEASQAPVGSFALAFSRLKESGGRLVVAGDHLQLPPILRGTYPKDASVPLFGSLMHALLRNARNEPVRLEGDALEATRQAELLVTLSQNYRMNDTLTTFAQELYGETFVPDLANRDLRIARLEAQRAEGADFADVVRAALDPERVMVTLVLRARPSRGAAMSWTYQQQVQCEARVVAALVRELHDNGRVLPDEERGLKGTFVVAPHHVQKSATRALLPPEVHSRVDTVDKIQGQEADVIIVCYAFMDLDRLERETDFVFSRQRLNVAMTRAKAKCVCVVSEEVLDPPLSVFAEEAARDGILHIAAWRAACADPGRNDTAYLEVGVSPEQALSQVPAVGAAGKAEA